MQDKIEFDNVLVGKDETEAHEWGAKTWGAKHAFESAEEVNQRANARERSIARHPQCLALMAFACCLSASCCCLGNLSHLPLAAAAAVADPMRC